MNEWMKELRVNLLASQYECVCVHLYATIVVTVRRYLYVLRGNAMCSYFLLYGMVTVCYDMLLSVVL